MKFSSALVVFLAALFVFQQPVLADQYRDKAKALVQEAAKLTQQAADLSASSTGTENVEKINALLKQAAEKVDEAREAAQQTVELTDDQKAGLVVGYGEPKGAANDPNHPKNLAEQTQNPVASLISVPLESNFNFGVGEADNFQYVLNAKPVLPMKLSDNWNLINRGIQPLIAQDNLTNTGTGIETDSTIFGMGDFTYQGFISPAKPGKVIWGAGPVLVIPWGEDGLSSEKWQAGAGFVALTKVKKWVFGSVWSQQWDVAGKGSAEDVSVAVWQYFINYNLNDGWFLTSSPTMTANWEADKTGDRLTIPYGGGLGKIFKIGDQPFRWSAQVFNYAATPDAVDNDWTLQAEFRLLFPQ